MKSLLTIFLLVALSSCTNSIQSSLTTLVPPEPVAVPPATNLCGPKNDSCINTYSHSSDNVCPPELNCSPPVEWEGPCEDKNCNLGDGHHHHIRKI